MMNQVDIGLLIQRKCVGFLTERPRTIAVHTVFPLFLFPIEVIPAARPVGTWPSDLKVLSRDFAVKIKPEFRGKRRPQNQPNLRQIRRISEQPIKDEPNTKQINNNSCVAWLKKGPSTLKKCILLHHMYLFSYTSLTKNTDKIIRNWYLYGVPWFLPLKMTGLNVSLQPIISNLTLIH